MAAGAFSKKLGVAAPLILIVVGVGFSFIPGAPVVVPHEVILLGLLPPILYSAALTVPVIDFRRNLTSISLLSVALVIVTAGITGFILYLLFPQLSLAAGIAIGAVISPTDAVAATALGKRLGLPPRLVTILEGEGLVNDATALVLLRSAVAATAASVAFWDVVGDFVFAAAVALAIGLVVGWVTVLVRSRLRDSVLDPMRELLTRRDWSSITLAAVAEAAGVSRQTIYNEFGSRQGLAQGYAIRLADRLVDAVDRAMSNNVGDIHAAFLEGFRSFFSDPAADPLVISLLNGAAKPDLLQIITTDSGPIITRSAQRLTSLFMHSWVKVSDDDAGILARAMVRLAISYVSMPPEADHDVAADLARLFTPAAQTYGVVDAE